MPREAERIREQLAQVERDLAEIDVQVDMGEIDDETASLLRSRYQNEREQLLGQLEATDETAPEPAAESFITGRRLVGVVILAIAAAVVTFGVVEAVGRTEPATGGVASEVGTENGVNLDDISNEEMEGVVAQNPAIAPMRLALADRYFDDGDFGNALDHYMYVLETLDVEDPVALANVGWMTYLSGVPDVAATFVERSIAVQPDGGIAFWYLANIRFSGLGDVAGAAEPLQRLLDYDNLPDDLRVEAEALLSEVQAAS
jgi:tetratricopeptide (TPR) repeat protein